MVSKLDYIADLLQVDDASFAELDYGGETVTLYDSNFSTVLSRKVLNIATFEDRINSYGLTDQGYRSYG